jgi:glycosyltransferase involved in cell wall biosynthesis
VKIAQVVASYHPQIGGLETHVRRLAEGCFEAGDQVVVLTHQVADSPVDQWIGGIRVLRFPMTLSSRNYQLSLSLFQYLRSHTADFDLVHAHSYHNLVGHAAAHSRLPFVFTPHYHGTGHTPFRAFLHRLYRPMGGRLFNKADAIICVSNAERDIVIKDFPEVRGKIVTIPNGTHPRPLLPDDDCVLPSRDIVLTVGRLERYKNVDLVIDAFRAMRSAATLVVVGDGPDCERLQRRAQPAKPGSPVIFTGKISDLELNKLLAKATVVTSASDHEAFGLVLADGLASGARVVASAIPAHAEISSLAGAGAPITLLDPRNTRWFADSLAASLAAGRTPVGGVRLPSWADVVADTRGLYSQVVAAASLGLPKEIR